MDRKRATTRLARRRRGKLRKVAGRFGDERSSGSPDLGVARPAPKAHIEEARVVLVPVDPHLAHVYWELDRGQFDRIREPHRAGPRAGALLKFRGVGDNHAWTGCSESSFDVEVDLAAGNRYVPIDRPARAYVVELGYRSAHGDFVSIARSSMAAMPPAQPAPDGRERYGRVSEVTGKGLLVEVVHEAPEAAAPGRSVAKAMRRHGQKVVSSGFEPARPPGGRGGIPRREAASNRLQAHAGPARPKQGARFTPIKPPFVAKLGIPSKGRSGGSDPTERAERQFAAGLDSSPITSPER